MYLTSRRRCKSQSLCAVMMVHQCSLMGDLSLLSQKLQTHPLHFDRPYQLYRHSKLECKYCSNCINCTQRQSQGSLRLLFENPSFCCNCRLFPVFGCEFGAIDKIPSWLNKMPGTIVEYILYMSPVVLPPFETHLEGCQPVTLQGKGPLHICSIATQNDSRMHMLPKKLPINSIN